MRPLTLGLVLLVAGGALIVSGAPALAWAGWALLALAAVVIVVKLAVGPRRPASLIRRA